MIVISGGIARAAAHLSAGRALELLFDLNLGMLPYIPVALIGPLGISLYGLIRFERLRVRLVALWCLVLVMAFMCTATGNWNHGTSGPSRYAVWLLPFVLYPLVLVGGENRQWLAGIGALAIVTQVAIVAGRGGMRFREDYLDHSYLARFVLERQPSLYRPSFEIFAERTTHQDGGAREPVVFVWRGRCRKAMLQKRHVEAVKELCGDTPALTRLRDKVAAEGRGRDVWVYIDY